MVSTTGVKILITIMVSRAFEAFSKPARTKIGIDPTKLTTFFPYWGASGVKFRWNQASLPNSSDAVETLSLKRPGPGSPDLELWLGEARHHYGPSAVSLVEVSRNHSFADAVDLAWDTASAVAPGELATATLLRAILPP